MILVKEHPAFSEEKVNAFQCDLTVDHLDAHVPKCSVDIATLVFVLSAVHPDKMLTVLQNIIQVQKNKNVMLIQWGPNISKPAHLKLPITSNWRLLLRA